MSEKVTGEEVRQAVAAAGITHIDHHDCSMCGVAADDPLMSAWKAYQQTDDFKNSKLWALRIAPMVHSLDPDAETKRLWDLMPLDQREQNVQGSLWASFVAGFQAAKQLKS